MKGAALGRELGIPHATMRTRLDTARSHLRRQIERYLMNKPSIGNLGNMAEASQDCKLATAPSRSV